MNKIGPIIAKHKKTIPTIMPSIPPFTPHTTPEIIAHNINHITPGIHPLHVVIYNKN